MSRSSVVSAPEMVQDSMENPLLSAYEVTEDAEAVVPLIDHDEM